jgi:hypothetical protein
MEEKEYRSTVESRFISFNERLKKTRLDDIEEIEDIIDDPVKFHQKLIENSIIDSDYLEFLNELEESGKTEAENIDHVEKYFTAEIEKLKEFYETQIQQVKEETSQAVESLKNENAELKQKIDDLENKSLDAAEPHPRVYLPRPVSTRNNFGRRNSDQVPVVQARLDSSRSRKVQNSSINGEMQYLEDENLKLKKSLDEQSDKLDRFKSKYENKFDSQKKTIDELKSEWDELRIQMAQQKVKHQKEVNKNKDLMKKMEKDMRNLKRGMESVQREKTELKLKLTSRQSNIKNSSNSVMRNKLNRSREVSKSITDRNFLESGKLSNSFMHRKSIQGSKRDNPWFSSTTSLKSFNLLKSYKNFSRKDSNVHADRSTIENNSFAKGDPLNVMVLDPNSSTYHKTCSRRGIWSVGHKHGNETDCKLGMKKGLNNSKWVSEAEQQIKNMCQLMVDSASRLEWSQWWELFIPTEFLEHVSGDQPCQGGLWKKETQKSSQKTSPDINSPVIKNWKAKIRNKENSHLDEINPVSERCSLMSLKKSSKKSPSERKTTLPQFKNTLKEKQLSQLSNLSYGKNTNEMKNSESIHNMSCSHPKMLELMSWKNQHNGTYDFTNQSVMCRNSIMTPMNYRNESFVIQPHCKNPIMQSHCAFHYNECWNHSQMIYPNESCSHFHAPTIEDRLENTENMIREMNAKFKDITSTKHSTKNEFEKLVQTLTLASAKDHYSVETESNEDWDLPADENNSDSEGESNDSSYDEETLNLNHKNLQQFFRSKNSKNSQIYIDDISSKIWKKNNKKKEEKLCFSKSRYQHVDSDCEDEQLEPFYDEQTKSYMIPEGKIDLGKASSPRTDQYSESDELYRNAKNSLDRTKILLLASQQDNEFLNEISYEEDSKNEVEILNLSSKRVKNILRNKEKRRNMKSSIHQEQLQKLKEKINEDSDSCKIQFSTDLDPDEESKASFKRRQSSRNQLHSQHYIQTTSSGNLVLYDSVVRSSCQSPQEMFDPHFIENKITNQHMKVYDLPHNYADYDDPLQDEKVAGKEFYRF